MLGLGVFGLLVTRIGIGIGLVWVIGLVGGSLGGVLWGCLSFPWGHGVLLFLSFPFFFLYIIGGSGVLSHGAVFGFFLSISFIFSFLCGHWDIF